MCNMIHTVRSTALALQRVFLLHHVQPIANMPVFQCCILPLGLSQSTETCIQMCKIIPNSDINGLITLSATFLALLHARLAIYITGDKQG